MECLWVITALSWQRFLPTGTQLYEDSIDDDGDEILGGIDDKSNKNILHSY